MSSGVTAHISLSALENNLSRVAAYAPSAKIMAMVKANAYGHGILPVVDTLTVAADGFAVARLEEAVLLRQNQLNAAVFVMAGFLDKEELKEMSELLISPVIHTFAQLSLLESIALKQPLRVWLKIDIGMHRLGIQPVQAPQAYRRLMDCPNVIKPIGIMTHFAQAEQIDTDVTPKQIAAFFQTVASCPGIDSSTVPLKSLANSAAIIAWPNSHQDWVRPGIMLYGVSPFPGTIGDDFGLQPVMTLKSRLIAIHQLAKGAALGYGGTWACPEDMPVGVASVGYGDGYPRHIKNGSPVLVNGRRCAVVGRVSMDLLIIDLRNCPEAQLGDCVILWGDGLPIEEVAACADTIAYELLCHVSSRVRFIYN